VDEDRREASEPREEIELEEKPESMETSASLSASTTARSLGLGVPPKRYSSREPVERQGFCWYCCCCCCCCCFQSKPAKRSTGASSALGRVKERPAFEKRSESGGGEDMVSGMTEAERLLL
jgi:hypothetical protein